MLKLQYFGPPDGKNQFIGKDPDAGKDWSQKEKGVRALDATFRNCFSYTCSKADIQLLLDESA